MTRIASIVTQEDLNEISKSENPAVFAIGGYADLSREEVYVLDGLFNAFRIPFGFFEPNPTATPSFDKFEISDWGMSLKFGNYECRFHGLCNVKEFAVTGTAG